MNTLDKFRDLQKQVETLKQEAARAGGSLDRVLDELKDGYGCDDLKSAGKLLRRTEKEAERLEEEFASKLGAFEEKWEGRLGDAE